MIIKIKVFLKRMEGGWGIEGEVQTNYKHDFQF